MNPDTFLVIENATFYSIEDNFLNCSTGPIGPLSIRNKYHKYPPLFHDSVYNPNNYHTQNNLTGSSKTNLETTSNYGWKSSTLLPSSEKQNQELNQWQQVTPRMEKADNIIANSKDLRQALNRRCSGMANGRICSFNLHLDHEKSQSWGSGLVDIFYRCIPKRTIETTCTSSVTSSSSNAYSSYSRSYKVDFLNK